MSGEVKWRPAGIGKAHQNVTHSIEATKTKHKGGGETHREDVGRLVDDAVAHGLGVGARHDLDRLAGHLGLVGVWVCVYVCGWVG